MYFFSCWLSGLETTLSLRQKKLLDFLNTSHRVSLLSSLFVFGNTRKTTAPLRAAPECHGRRWRRANQYLGRREYRNELPSTAWWANHGGGRAGRDAVHNSSSLSREVVPRGRNLLRRPLSRSRHLCSQHFFQRRRGRHMHMQVVTHMATHSQSQSQQQPATRVEQEDLHPVSTPSAS